MNDLLTSIENPYKPIYDALGEVREIFHREGRLNDANAKLDETVKFLAIHYAGYKGLLTNSEYRSLCDINTFSITGLQNAFIKVAQGRPFITEDGTSIFGTRPHIAFEQGDENVAFQLFLVSGYAIVAQNKSERPLDVLNEAFGHHVRDNFRNNIEDAQYMTPPEVVSFMVSLASEMILRNPDFKKRDRFIMMDPSCGVGSFLTAWRSEYERHNNDNCQLPPLIAIGQDKVERMARLAAMNLILSDNSSDIVYSGNSITDGSHLDEYNGKVDLILTNPPFGAKFQLDEIRIKSLKSTPIFSTSALQNKTVDSELLFIDRYLSLLRDGGLLLAVVPDGVISAKGIPAFLRQQIARRAILHGVIELPPVTFAQAGTRTKTAILVIEKSESKPPRRTMVFFGEVDDIGFDVSKRKGVPIKKLQGHNQLLDVLDAFKRKSDSLSDRNGQQITATWRDIEPIRHDAWTPRQFRIDGDRVHQQARGDGIRLCQLSELVIKGPRRKSEPYKTGKLFISVLHVIGEGILDIDGVMSYRPITPGIPISPGEVIISRLNPRIPRVLVVPDLGKPLLCSSEFEVLKPRNGFSPYAIAYMLMSSVVQEQIQALTAGTSASHSRVKPERLYEIKVPWPSEPDKSEFLEISSGYEKSMRTLVTVLTSIHKMRQAERELICA